MANGNRKHWRNIWYLMVITWCIEESSIGKDNSWMENVASYF